MPALAKLWASAGAYHGLLDAQGKKKTAAPGVEEEVEEGGGRHFVFVLPGRVTRYERSV